MIPTPEQPIRRYGSGAANWHTGETVVLVRRASAGARHALRAVHQPAGAARRDAGFLRPLQPTPRWGALHPRRATARVVACRLRRLRECQGPKAIAPR